MNDGEQDALGATAGPNRGASRLDAKLGKPILAPMSGEHSTDRVDTRGELASGPTLTPVRKPGESHLLALISAAALVLVAIAIAKPWGGDLPSPKGTPATTSPALEVARYSIESAPSPERSAVTVSLIGETDQQVLVVIQPGDSPYALTWVCTDHAETSPSAAESADPVIDWGGVSLRCATFAP